MSETNFPPDDPTGEIRRATLLVMKFLEERGEFGDYEAIEKKIRKFLAELLDEDVQPVVSDL